MCVYYVERTLPHPSTYVPYFDNTKNTYNYYSISLPPSLHSSVPFPSIIITFLSPFHSVYPCVRPSLNLLSLTHSTQLNLILLLLGGILSVSIYISIHPSIQLSIYLSINTDPIALHCIASMPVHTRIQLRSIPIPIQSHFQPNPTQPNTNTNTKANQIKADHIIIAIDT